MALVRFVIVVVCPSSDLEFAASKTHGPGTKRYFVQHKEDFRERCVSGRVRWGLVWVLCTQGNAAARYFFWLKV